VKAAQLILCWYRAFIPRLSARCIGRSDERECDAVWIVEREDSLFESFSRTFDRDIVRLKPVVPVVERTLRNKLSRGPCLSVTEPS
jgi:hypothetical protein